MRTTAHRKDLRAAVAAAERDLDGLLLSRQRHLRLLQLLVEVTGAPFAEVHLVSEDLGLLGGITWPGSPERQRAVADHATLLSALIQSGMVRDFMWSGSPGQAFAVPEPILHNSEAYRQVYARIGVHHLAWYVYPPTEDRKSVIVALASHNGPFTARAVRTLQHVCDHFSTEFVDAIPIGGRYAKATSIDDHSVEINEFFETSRLSPHLHAMLVHFFGAPSHVGGGTFRLPSDFVAEFEINRKTSLQANLPFITGQFFAFSRRRHGRALEITARALDHRAWHVTCHEDLTQVRYLTRVRSATEALRRDRPSVYSACLAIIDGERDERAILARAGLGALKASSGRRIVNLARRILEQV